MKTHIRDVPISVGLLTSSALPAALCVVWLSSAFSTGLAQQKLKPGATVTRTVPAKTVTVQRNDRPPHDYSGIGGSVYATGLGEVTVTIHHVRSFLADKWSWVYPTSVSMVSNSKLVLLGSNHETRATRLGKLARGEIQLIANCPIGDGVLISGLGSRNTDGKPRSRACDVRPGVVEVYFEDSIREGTRNDEWEQHWYKDVKLTFTGAVTADTGLITVLDKINDPDPNLRRGAREALKMVWPSLARQVNYD